MQVEEIIGNNLNDVSKAITSEIEISSSLELENFVVVPDRFSLLAEKLVFEQLEIVSTFNIKVLGISALSKYFSKQEESLSQNESKLLIYQILKNENFEFFEPKLEIASELYKIVSQLKSSAVLPSEIVSQAKTKKQSEIAKIFDLYEKEKSKQDQNDLISNLTQNLDVEKVSRSSFFFAGFDSLTAQGAKLLEKLCVYAKRVVVGATVPQNQKNSNVYDCDIHNKLKTISKNNKIEIRKKYLKKEEKNLSTHILNNLFSYSPKVVETNKVHLLEFETAREEIQQTAKTILFYVKKKQKQFCNFNILCGNLENNVDEIENIFKNYQIPFFVDCSKKISQLPIYNFFKNLFEFVKDENAESFLNIALNPYVCCPSEVVSKVKNELDLRGKFDFEVVNQFDFTKEILNKIINFKKKTLKKQYFNEFLQLIDEIIEDFLIYEKNKQLVAQFSNNLSNEKIYVQIPKAIQEICNSICCQQQVEFEDFSNIFLELLGEKEISSVPISTDCVFVGTDKSFFEQRDVLFVVNASLAALPKVVSNCGVFLDEDIKACAPNVEPTVKMINKRNKQKLLFDLCPNEELFVSVCGNELGEKVEKSVVFAELQKIFTFKGKPLEILNSFFFQFLDQEKIAEFEIQSEKDFKNKIYELFEEGKISKQTFEKYFACIKPQEEKINTAKMLYKNFSPTGLENFFLCPFKHFFQKGLRVQENERNVFDGKDFGNYFHKSAENFVRRNLKKLGSLSESEIEAELEKINLIVKDLPRFKLLSKNIENCHIFEILKKETKVLFEKINYEQKYSNFVAKFLEQNFSICFGNTNVVGSVDRVDFCENLFRIVDYKSGEIKESLRAVYEGLELQLFIYIIAIMQNFGGQACGGFYLQINNDFNAKNEKFKLTGFFVDKNEVVKNLDRRLGNLKQSDIVNIKLTQKSTLDNLQLSTRKNVLTQEGFNAVIEYVKLLIKSAEEEIMSGKIEARAVDETVCKRCKFYAICSFNRLGNELALKHSLAMEEKDFIGIVENGRN